MPGNPLAPVINVIIGQPSNINVQVGPTAQPRVTGITYGGRTLISATDLDIGTGAVDGEVIAYNASSNTFVLETTVAPTEIDGGGF